ncbi:hypothetical protein V8C86DRAFT_3142508 [Haematococcus lacustris]
MTELELESGVRSPELESGVGEEEEEEEADEEAEEEEETAFDRVVVPWSDGKELFAELIAKTHSACAGKTNVAMETLLAAEVQEHSVALRKSKPCTEWTT